MMRMKETPRPTLKPTMAFSLRLARELCAELCETCGREGRVRADDVKFIRNDVVVLVKPDSVALVRDLDMDGLGVFEVFFGCGVDEEKIEDVRVGDDPMAVVGMVPDREDIDRLHVDILAGLVRVDSSIDG
jgi:hypothetical protein